MKMIYKYPLGNDIHHNAVVEIEMPKAAKILDIQYQGNSLVIWALINPKHMKRMRTFHIFGTGFEMSDYDKKHYDYIATVQAPSTHVNLVWHIFEVHE